MAYKLSKARKAFEGEVDKLIITLQNSKKTKKLNPSFKEHITCSCIILCMAQLEIYVEDVVSNWIGAINRTPTQCSALPPELRAFFLQRGTISNAFKKYVFADNETELVQTLSNSFSTELYNLSSNTALTPSLDPKELLQNKYPSPKNLKKYFARIGMTSIFHKLNVAAKTNMELILDSFNDIRTAVAHDGIIPGASQKDIIVQLKRMKRFVATLDRVVYKHIAFYAPISTWVI